MGHAFKVKECLQGIEVLENANQSAIICTEKRLQHQADKQLRLRVSLGTIAMRIVRQMLTCECKGVPGHAQGRFRELIHAKLDGGAAAKDSRVSTKQRWHLFHAGSRACADGIADQQAV